MKELTHLSLFSGIGGLDIAAEMAGFRTVGQCEWADYPTKVLEKHWPDVPRWRDIRTLTGDDFHEWTGLGTVDVISGGFPCQPFSVAGKRRGKDDDRYLWPEMLRVIQELRPGWVVGENVAGIVNMALDQVYADLEGIGYTVQALIIPAVAVDAPHRRDRCAIVAHNNDVRRILRGFGGEGVHRDAPCHEADPGGKDMADPEGKRRGEAWEHIGRPEERAARGGTLGNPNGIPVRDDGQDRGQAAGKIHETGDAGGDSGRVVSHADCDGLEKPGLQRLPEEPGISAPDDSGWEIESRLGGMAAGFSAWLDRGMSAPGYWLPEPEGIPRITIRKQNRVDRLKCLGNAVVPQQFYPVFRAIAEIERENRI